MKAQQLLRNGDLVCFDMMENVIRCSPEKALYEIKRLIFKDANVLMSDLIAWKNNFIEAKNESCNS